jgi:beta-galactosidase
MSSNRPNTTNLNFVLLHILCLLPFLPHIQFLANAQNTSVVAGRSRTSLNSNWRFHRFTSNPDNISYAKWKPWILPSANNFITNPSNQHKRPADQPANVSYAQPGFDDSTWEALIVPHDWAIKGPFYNGTNTPVSGAMGRLPSQGVGWYRRAVSLAAEDMDKAVYLEIDGAMSYAIVWLNGVFVGGWPYGYASFRMDLTPYMRKGDNVLSIRLDQALDSSRWYPGGGIYRNVWLTKVHTTHVGQSGTWIRAKDVSAQKATLDMSVQVENSAANGKPIQVQVMTDVHVLDATSGTAGAKVGEFPSSNVIVGAGSLMTTNASVTLQNPKLWGPRPAQEPNMHVAITRLYVSGEVIDTYETPFGIRALQYSNDGVHINGQRIYLQGVCQHHDLGSLGAAFNVRAAERQLEVLQDMGTNAIRTSHNPPAPELLQLADRMGFVVLDEIFDTWNSHKTSNDFQSIFTDWSEPDLRAFLRRDRNHPSIWAWSFGNEIAEQGQSSGGATAQRLRDIIREEDTTRKTSVAMDSAKPDSAIPSIVDLIGLNYQGERGSFPSFRKKFPDKMIFSTESSSVVSSRGTYLFPVTGSNGAFIPNSDNGTGKEGEGVDAKARQISSYELYSVNWGASPDKVFAAQDQNPYVGGEFVWTGWDYIGEPTPYDLSRSSYFGIIDLAGFPKDRFYLYQARWNPELKMAHILPHWNWPDRVGKVTPVHVFSSGDEAELFVNGVSQGRVKKPQYTYRFRWDKVIYQSGEVRVATYKGGKEWANATIRTTGAASQLRLTSYRNRTSITPDGNDLAFVSVAVVDDKGDVVPQAEPEVTFSVTGPGEIVSTDNGDPTDMTVFPSKQRKAFRGLALAIVKAKAGGGNGSITVTAEANGLKKGSFTLGTG